MPPKSPVWNHFYGNKTKFKTNQTHNNAWCKYCVHVTQVRKRRRQPWWWQQSKMWWWQIAQPNLFLPAVELAIPGNFDNKSSNSSIWIHIYIIYPNIWFSEAPLNWLVEAELCPGLSYPRYRSPTKAVWPGQSITLTWQVSLTWLIDWLGLTLVNDNTVSI
jgi:hypothetical protein